MIYLLKYSLVPTHLDFLWLTVKCTGVETALKDIQKLVRPTTIILCCQNGLGSEVLVKQAFPHNQVLRVMVPFNVVELRAGYYHRGSEGHLTIEVTESTRVSISDLVAILNCDLLPVTKSSEIYNLLWAKLQLNLSNSVCALADSPVKAMLQQHSYRRVIALLMRELAIAYVNGGIEYLQMLQSLHLLLCHQLKHHLDDEEWELS